MGIGCLVVGASELLSVEDLSSSFCDCWALVDDAVFSSSDDASSLEDVAPFLTAAAIFSCLGSTQETLPSPLLLVCSLSLEELEELSSKSALIDSCLFFLLVDFFVIFLIFNAFCSSSSSELDSVLDCLFFFAAFLLICFPAFLFFEATVSFSI